MTYGRQTDRMSNLRRIILLLRAVIVALFGLLVVFETLSLPGQFLNHRHPSRSELAVDLLLTAVAVSWAVCLQVALVAGWRILTLVESDQIFTGRSLGPMNVLVRTTTTVVATLALTFLGVGITADDPGAPMMLLMLLLVVTTACLVLYVVRDVVRRAVGATAASIDEG